MNCRLLLLFCLLLTALGLQAQVQYTTENPRVDDVNDRDVTIRRVELTEQYTIIYMKFEAKGMGSMGRSWPFPIPMPNGGRGSQIDVSSHIGFQPASRLYVNQGERSYKFIRAENIPAETRRRVEPGERVDFIAYFERIDPGYTVFDLFECKDGNGYVCFNFWGVHIINPARKDTYSQRTPKPKPPVQAKPRYTPRTTPGVGTPDETPARPEAETAPAASIAINGITRDARTKKPITATVTYRLISGAEATGDDPGDSVRSVSPAGKYTIPIDRRGVYAVTASAKGYFSQSDTLTTNRVDVMRDFNLVPIETGAKITLRNIYFNASKFDLKPESFPELDRLVEVMQENSTMNIRLEGHTDTVGDFDANVELSRNRVNEVKRYLVSKGISAGRIETVGYGPSRPINTNKSLKERPENRRVEMVVVKV
ncbi:OmpA family protein [Spirosoma taeanense]|uniref:OmpA family protein n=1 Tax=Spirosoma taeanense TaxID=2735870 RepID=A0A6M5YE00_9BACT|nr:OmpA family protein [Spirosoma taeanense]QJW91546.1 OmpA family protein [Spirosoma taeanense]